MALIKRNLNIAFSQGVDTKTDPKQVVIGKLLDLRNGFFQTPQEIRKRNGNALLGSSLTTGNSLANFKDELMASDGTNIKSYSEEQNSFNTRGEKIALDLSISSIIRNTSNQTYQNSAYNGGYYCYTYKSNNVSKLSVFDAQTGSNILLDYTLEAGADIPKVKALGNYFVVLYVVGTSLKYVSIAISAPGTVNSPVTLAADSLSPYDFYFSTNLYIVYQSSTDLKVFTLSPILVQSSVATITGEGCLVALNIFVDSGNSQVWIVYNNTSNNLKAVVYNAALGAQIHAPFTIEAQQSNNITGLALSGTATIYYECPNTDNLSQDEFIKKAIATNAGSVTSTAVLVRSVGLASKVFQYNSNNYILTVHQSSLQPTYFLFNATATSQGVVGKVAQDNAGGLQLLLVEVNQIASNQFEFAYLIKDLLTTQGTLTGDVVYTQTGVNSGIFTFNDSINNSEIANNSHLSGALLSMYDGANVVEHSYNLFPEDISAAQLVNAGALSSASSYNYSQTYEWTDNQGQIHRSAPSIAVNVTPTNTTVLNGYLTSGSSQIKQQNVGASQGFIIFPKNLYIGQTVTGTGIPANTVISSFTRTVVAGQTNYFINLNNNATATGLESLTFTDIPISVTVTSNNSRATTSKTLVLVAPGTFAMQIAPNPSNLAQIATNPGALVVGQTFFSQYHTAITYTVNSVNGSQAILSGNFNEDGNVCTFNGTVQAQNFIFPGMTITFSGAPTGWPASVNVVSVSVNTITVDTTIPYTADPTTGILTQVSGSIANIYGASVQMPTLRLTDKSNVSLQMYRTLADETEYHRVSSVLAPVVNDKTIDYEIFADGTGDGTLSGNDLLYTNGGVLENIASPATSFVTEYQSRLLILPSESPNSFWYSQQVIPGDPVEFNDLLVWNVDNRGGPITAMHQMDDKLIIFKENTIFYMTGQGPSPTGDGNDFTPTLLISTDSGCSEPKSLVIMPSGLMYKSLKGIYLLDRSLGVHYIGAPVEAFNGDTVTSAVLIDKLNQVRFTLNSGHVLMFDYIMDQWSIFDNINALDSLSFQNEFTYIDASGNVLKENPNLYTDNGSFIPLSLTMSWLSFSGLQGFERLTKFMVLGQYFSPHILNVSFAYDFVDASTQTIQVPVTSSPSTAYQYRLFPQRQKCEALKVSIVETQSAAFGQGLSISGMAMEVGLKTGINKLPASQSYG